MPGLYSTRGWLELRSRQLRREPTCRLCREAGRVAPATVADHVEPHRGDRGKFYDASNLQSLCRAHHDSLKQKVEKRGLGFVPGSDPAGLPLDAGHPWFSEDRTDD